MEHARAVHRRHGASYINADLDGFRPTESLPSSTICLSVRPRTNSIQRPMRVPICSAP